MKLATILFLILISVASAVKADLRIIFEKSDCPIQICGSGQSIYLEGEIGPDDAARLESEILANGSPAYSRVYFSSPGGSLFGGMEIGRLIRKYGYNTALGAYSANSNYPEEGAGCFSACTLAYLGGVFRYASDKSPYGVHRFYSPIQTGEAEQSAQVASGAIISFLSDMGISSDFFIEMTHASPDSIRIITADQMLAMGISNNGIGKTTWSINALQNDGTDSLLYLKGERDTTFGVNKIIFACLPREGIVMHVIYDPQGRDEEAKGMLAVTVALDDIELDFSNNITSQIVIENGWANADFSVPEEIWSLVQRSQTMSVMFQSAKDAPTFLGINSMPLEDAKDLMSGLTTTCAK